MYLYSCLIAADVDNDEWIVKLTGLTEGWTRSMIVGLEDKIKKKKLVMSKYTHSILDNRDSLVKNIIEKLILVNK